MTSSEQEVPKGRREALEELKLKRGTLDPSSPVEPGSAPPIIPQKTREFLGPVLGKSQFGEEAPGKQLLIGKDISLSGTINSCDKLIVAGSVETKISECRELEITSEGLFKGEAEIEIAEIAGEFVGNLSADLIIIRSNGRISGNLAYGRLEVERGGEIVGNISRIGEKKES